MALSYAVRRILVRDSIYTRKLALRGHTMPEALQANLHFVRRASGIMDTMFVVANVSQTMADVGKTANGEAPRALVVTGREENIIGVIIRDQCPPDRHFPSSDKLESIALKDFVTISPDALFAEVLSEMHFQRASVARVVTPASSNGASQHKSLEAGLDLFG